MPKTLSIREESDEEKKLREWFDTQALESPKNLEEAARLIIGLVTGLLSLSLGVLTLSAPDLPPYLLSPLARTCGVVAVVLWLFCILAALIVVLPRRWQLDARQPISESEVFYRIMRHKSTWLTLSAGAFGFASISMGIILVYALLAT